MASATTVLSLGLAGVLAGATLSQCNSPYPAGDADQSIYYYHFTEEPKHLDPAQAYTTDEEEWVCRVVEPPLHYHYFKRPFELEPLTVEAVPRPEPRRVSFRGQMVDAVVYTLRVQPGIRYQDHPCFVPANRRLTPAQVRHVGRVWDVRPWATRELVAGDYALGLRRLADPRVACPIYSTLAQNLLGLEEYQQRLQERLATERQARRAAAGALYNAEEDEKRRPIALDYAELAEGCPFVRAVDRYTFEVVLRQPYPQILHWMAMAFFAPVPPEALEFFDQPAMIERSLVFDGNPMGTGPFRLAELDPIHQMVFERNGNYRDQRYPTLPAPPADDPAAVARYRALEAAGVLADAGQRLPLVDRLVLRLEKESIPRWNKFLQGYYDASEITGDVFDQAVSLSSRGDSTLTDDLSARNIRLVTATTTQTNYGAFNLLDPVVGGYTPQKRKLRQAISIAYDIEEKIAVFDNGRALAAQGPIPPGIFGHQEGRAGVNPGVYRWDEALQKPVRRPLEDAQRLLAEAGYPGGFGPDGQPLVIRMISSAATPEARTGLTFARKQFARLGIRLDIAISDYNRFQDRVKTGDFQFLSWGWVADYPDPENFLFLLHGPNAKVKSGGNNYANYANPRYDELFVQMRALENTPERGRIIREMVDILREDAPWLFGDHPIAYGLYHQWYRNAWPHGMAFDTAKYRRVDVAQRAAYRAEQNRPRVWPLLLVGVLVLGTAVPAVRGALRRFREV